MQRKIYALYLLLLWVPFADLQAQQLNCTAQIFGPQAMYSFVQLATDNSGNLYACGHNDYSLVKYSTTGSILWSKPSHDDISPTAITIDANGNAYLAGIFTSSITFGSITLNNTAAGTSNIFVVKYDADGVVQWAVATGQKVGNVKGLGVDANGNVFLSGTFSGAGNLFGSISLTATGTTEGYIAKLDNTGTPVWAKVSVSTTAPNKLTTLTSLALDGDGNAYVTGYFNSTIQFGSTTPLSTAAGEFDIFVVKYTTDGTEAWAKSFISSGNDTGSDIAADTEGNIYITGGFNNHLGVICYTQAGVFSWSNITTGDGISLGFAIVADSDGNSYAVGSYSGTNLNFGSFTLESSIGNEGSESLVLKINSDGTANWIGQGSGTKNDGAHTICLGTNNALYFSGYSNSPSFQIGFSSLTGPAVYLAHMSTLNIVTSVTPGNNLLSNLYPNPTHGTVHIEGIEEASWKVKVTSMNGHCVHQTEVNGSKVTVDLSSQKKGIYMLELYKEDTYFGAGKIAVE